jgi:hypothetical protein
MVKTELDLQSSQESEALHELKLACMDNLLGTPETRVYFKDLHSRFLLVSAGCIATPTPGNAVEELIGKTDFDFYSKEHAAAAFEDEQQIIRTGEPVVGKLERRPSTTEPMPGSRPARCRFVMSAHCLRRQWASSYPEFRFVAGGRELSVVAGPRDFADRARGDRCRACRWLVHETQRLMPARAGGRTEHRSNGARMSAAC